jgi:hypothetical protein
LTVCDDETGDLDLDLNEEGGGDGTLMASFDLDEHCEREFSVVVDVLAEGDYDLYVGAYGPFTIEVGAGGSGEMVFSTEPEEGEEPLTFDPRGETIELVDGDELTVFEGDFPAS